MNRTVAFVPRARVALTVSVVVFALSARAVAADPPPPPAELNFETAATSAAPGHDNGSSFTSSSWFCRQPVGWRTLLWTLGAQAEYFDFASGPVTRLQDYAAIVGAEYYVDGEKAAELSLRPGLYFGSHASRGAWDIPIDLVSGVPITKTFNGVVGFANARFYHHALPIFGLVWNAMPALKVQLVYPEPALEYTLTPKWSARLAGELVGAGFLVQTPTTGPTPVEYSSYRVGLGLVRKIGARSSVELTGGIEALRNFDAFRAGGLSRDRGGTYVRLAATISP